MEERYSRMKKKIISSGLGLSPILFFASLAIAHNACRAKIEKAEGETPTGDKLDPALPKDARFLELFTNVAVVDYAQEPKHSKCTYNFYDPDENTKNFPTAPNPDASVSTFSYDSAGRKIKEVYEYGSSSYRSKSVTEWTYDPKSRVSKTILGSLKTDGTTQISSHCVYTYDGDSDRLSNKDCFSGDGTSEKDKNSSVEITYDLSQKKRTIVERRREYSGQTTELRIASKAEEEHADTDYTFAINAKQEDYQFDDSSNTDKLERISTIESQFKDGKFSTIKFTNFDVAENVRKVRSQGNCELSLGKLKCKGSQFNESGDTYENFDTEYTPILIKYRASDIFVCPSPANCRSEQISSKSFKLTGLMTSWSSTGVEGKLDRGGNAPSKRKEETATYSSPLRPWMLESAPNSKSYYQTAQDKHGESQTITTASENGSTITEISQKRKNNGTAETRDALGDFENDSKKETICELN